MSALLGETEEGFKAERFAFSDMDEVEVVVLVVVVLVEFFAVAIG